MTREDIIRIYNQVSDELCDGKEWAWTGVEEPLQRFAALVATTEKQKVVEYMNSRAFATGHGDTIEDLLKEMEWQVAEREREACAKLCDGWTHADGDRCAAAIRARESK